MQGGGCRGPGRLPLIFAGRRRVEVLPSREAFSRAGVPACILLPERLLGDPVRDFSPGSPLFLEGTPPPPASLPPSQPRHLSPPRPGPRPCLPGTSLYSATSQVALGCLSRMCPGAAKKPSRSPSPPGASPSRAPSAAKPQLSGPRSLALPGTLLWVPDFLPCSSHSPVGGGGGGQPPGPALARPTLPGFTLSPPCPNPPSSHVWAVRHPTLSDLFVF